MAFIGFFVALLISGALLLAGFVLAIARCYMGGRGSSDTWCSIVLLAFGAYGVYLTFGHAPFAVVLR